MRRFLLVILILLLPTAATVFLYFNIKTKKIPTSREAVGQVTTLAGAGYPGLEDGTAFEAAFSDPFGIAVDIRGNVLVADGGEANRIRRITPEGKVDTVAGSSEGFADGRAASSEFNTPSGIATDKRGNLFIADTANNRIRELGANGEVSTVAGSGARGYRDGPASEAQFDGPLAVALDGQGNVYITDSYNDRIRRVSIDGEVTTVAGTGTPGFSDGPALSAQFDTPAGIAVDEQGNVYVADTGNHAIRKITPQGEVSTLRDSQDPPTNINRPISLVVTHDGFLFVADERGRVYRISPESEFSLFAGSEAGYAEGVGAAARFNSPSGIAIDGAGNIYVADTQNYLIRKIVPVAQGSNAAQTSGASEKFIQPPVENGSTDSVKAVPRFDRIFQNAGQSFPWPVNPQDQWHEVTGLVGEARGASGGVALDHLHSGLDIRGNMGEPALSVLDEKISSPIPAWGFGNSGEGIGLRLMRYIHIRVGRNERDEIQAQDKFKPRLDETGKIIGIRARRGTRFKVGDFLGTINSLYHVHLNLGPWNAEANPINFPFVGFKDTIAPTIEPDGIEVVNQAGEAFKQKRDGRLIVSGDIDIIVTAYDRVDGNGNTRKLGLYKAGYQLFTEDGAAVKGFEEPLINIDFHRLPPDDSSVFIAYAPGSGVSAYGTPTKFRYIVTNRVRDGEARDGLFRTSELAPGHYILRVVAEDFAGNRASGKSIEMPLFIEAAQSGAQK